MARQHEEDDGDDDEFDKTKSREKRFELWFTLFFCSLVTFGVLCDLFWVRRAEFHRSFHEQNEPGSSLQLT
jgi:hypothetical protein